MQNKLLGLLLLLMGCLAAPFSWSQTAQPLAPRQVHASPRLVIVQIAPGSYVHTSYLQTNDFGLVPCNGLLVVSQNEAIVFDTPTNDSASNELMAWAQQTLKAKITAIVPTHFHNDCLGGLPAFHVKGIVSYAHDRTIALAKANNMPIPQKGFADSLVLPLGREKVCVKFFGEGHTRDNVVGYFEKDQVLFGGCLIKELNATKGYLGDANVKEWSHTVQKMVQAYPSSITVVPGHGQVGNKKLLDYTIQLFQSSLGPH